MYCIVLSIVFCHVKTSLIHVFSSSTVTYYLKTSAAMSMSMLLVVLVMHEYTAVLHAKLAIRILCTDRGGFHTLHERDGSRSRGGRDDLHPISSPRPWGLQPQGIDRNRKCAPTGALISVSCRLGGLSFLCFLLEKYFPGMFSVLPCVVETLFYNVNIIFLEFYKGYRILFFGGGRLRIYLELNLIEPLLKLGIPVWSRGSCRTL